MLPAADPPDPSLPPAARRALERVAGFLKIARVLIEDGRQINLSGFDAEVGRLCAAVLDIDPVLARAIEPRLRALLGEIETIESKLSATGPVPAD